MSNRLDPDTRQKVIDLLKKYSKKSISTDEATRAESKGKIIDCDFLRDLLSRRIYNNIKGYVSNLSYEEMTEIATENDINITGNKKYGCPEIEFADRIYNYEN